MKSLQIMFKILVAIWQLPTYYPQEFCIKKEGVKTL